MIPVTKPKNEIAQLLIKGKIEGKRVGSRQTS